MTTQVGHGLNFKIPQFRQGLWISICVIREYKESLSQVTLMTKKYL